MELCPFHFISFHLLFHRVRKNSYKTKQTLKMQTCSNDTMISQDTLYKVKPVDSTPCRITKCELNHNRVDLLKVLPAYQTPLGRDIIQCSQQSFRKQTSCLRFVGRLRSSLEAFVKDLEIIETNFHSIQTC